MTQAQKIKFIKSLTNSVRDYVIGKVPHMPEEWDGHELRQYLADQFAHEIGAPMREPRSRRLREYRNEVATRPL